MPFDGGHALNARYSPSQWDIPYFANPCFIHDDLLCGYTFVLLDVQMLGFLAWTAGKLQKSALNENCFMTSRTADDR